MPTDSIRDAAFCDVLNRELVCALGCTEPIAVAYAAALASQTLGCEPDHMDVACSGNIIKNVKSVTVPNSGGMHGIEAAAVLGAVGGDAKSALEVLESVDDEDRARVAELLADAGYCDVSLVEGVPNLYIKAVSYTHLTQKFVTGTVRLKFFKGNCHVVGRKSPFSLYDYGLATYDRDTTFDEKASAGFIEIDTLSLKTWAKVQGPSSAAAKA